MFRSWWSTARRVDLGIGGDEPPTEITLYHDPLIDIRHRAPVAIGLINAMYLSPQSAEDAQELFAAAAGQAGLLADEPQLLSPRLSAAALLLAREWDRPDLASRIGRAIDDAYEPTWERESGEFTWGLGLDEEHPRGQYNALLAAAETVTPGAWARLGNERMDDGGPQVVGIEFPAVALSVARWDDGELLLRLQPGIDRALGDPTAFTVEGLPDGEFTAVSSDGSRAQARHVDDALRVTTVVGSHDIVVRRRATP